MSIICEGMCWVRATQGARMGMFQGRTKAGGAGGWSGRPGSATSSTMPATTCMAHCSRLLAVAWHELHAWIRLLQVQAACR